jgi:iron complex outermembrane receptor protein
MASRTAISTTPIIRNHWASLGLFGQATYTPDFLNDRAHLTLGGRYSHDKKTGTLDKVNGALPVVNGVAAVLPLDAAWGRFDPTVNLSFDVTDDVHVYGKWSTGYKAGGANSRSLTYRAFSPESVSSFEIGAKTEFLDHHARLNLAAFTSEYKDVQIDFSAVIPGSNRGTIETTNAAGSGRSRGLEAELTLIPFRGLTLTANYAYTHVRLPEAPNPFVTGNPLVPVFPIYTPRHAASVSGDYEVPLGELKAGLHLDANYAAIGAEPLQGPDEENVPEEQAASPAEPKASTKTGMVLDMLRRDDGATLDELATATGWLSVATCVRLL